MGKDVDNVNALMPVRLQFYNNKYLCSRSSISARVLKFA